MQEEVRFFTLEPTFLTENEIKTWLFIRYKNVVKDNQIDLILYVASADEKPDLKLFRAIQKARGESKDEKIKSEWSK